VAQGLADVVCEGDTNADGVVDLNDLLTVLSNFGTDASGRSNGDVVGDGTVDLNDLLLVLSNFGTDCN
jgi:Ca2+-binding EF-hand superfamily protein